MTKRLKASLVALACCLGVSQAVADDALTPTAPPSLDSPAPAPAPTPQPPVATPPPVAQPAQPAPAANGVVTTLSSFSVGNWNASAYSQPGSQALDNCGGGALYNGGVTLGFWVDRNYQWGMYLVKTTWRLNQGANYNITYSIDNSPPVSATATATSPTAVAISMPGDTTLFERFMQGSWLNVVAAETSFPFALTDTSQFLPALLKCVDKYMQPSAATKAANPFQTLIRP